jgi:aspartate aminotransferase
MAILARARELEAQGRDIVHMELGEPDFPTPRHIIEAGFRAAQEGYTTYTPAEGLLELREALSRYYRREYGINIGSERFIITMGSSPGLWLLFAAILDPGDAVLMSNPHYACYPNDVRFVGGEPVTFPVFADDGFQVDPKRAREAITKRTKILLINSPANPTGAVTGAERMREIAGLPVEHIISDEIYHRLTYGVKAHSMLEYRDDAIVISGFSKLYAMTGWRLGWIIVPPAMVEPLRRLHQNLFLCASAFVQKAGVAALEGPQDEIEKMIATYAERRMYILSALRELGLKIPVEPQGAFYILADARQWDANSERLSQRLLEEAGVAVTPGIDFGDNAEGFLRFCYAASLERMKEGVGRMRGWIPKHA